MNIAENADNHSTDVIINPNPAELPQELLYAVTAAGGRDKLELFSYLRCSSPRQLRGDSVRRQIELRNKVLWKYGLPAIIEDYRDLGVSALRGKNKAIGALSLFLGGCRAGKIKRGAVLLVESLDRISRQEIRKALRLFLEIIDEYHITIWTLGGDQRIYSPQPAKSDLEEILISICIMSRAHEESVLKRERIMEKRAIRVSVAKETGKPLCKRTLCWLKPRSTPSTDGTYYDKTEKAKDLQLMFQLAMKGWGAPQIAKHFRHKGIKGWSVSQVNRTLRNPAVCGWCQPYRWVDGRKIPDGEPWKNHYPRVIEQSVFDEVQILLDARVERYKMISGRRELSKYPNNGGILPDLSGHGRLSEISLFTTSILLDESDEDSQRTMYLGYNKQENGKTIPYLSTHRNRGEADSNHIRYDFFETAVLFFLDKVDWDKIAHQTEPPEVKEWEVKLQSVSEAIYGIQTCIDRDIEDLQDPKYKKSKAAKDSLDRNEARLVPLLPERDFILTKIASLREGARVFTNIDEFKKLIHQSMIDLTKGLPIPPDVMEARKDLRIEIHRKISMFTFNFMETQEGLAADIQITFANGVVHLMTLFCVSFRGFYTEPDETLLGSFDFDPDGGKARGRRCFTLKFKDGWTLDQIAAKLDMNRITVHKTLRGKIRPYLYFEWFGQWPDGKISDHYLSEEGGKEVLKYHEQGLTYLEIACKTERNRRTVSNLIKAAGIRHFNRRNGAQNHQA